MINQDSNDRYQDSEEWILYIIEKILNYSQHNISLSGRIFWEFLKKFNLLNIIFFF